MTGTVPLLLNPSPSRRPLPAGVVWGLTLLVAVLLIVACGDESANESPAGNATPPPAGNGSPTILPDGSNGDGPRENRPPPDPVVEQWEPTLPPPVDPLPGPVEDLTLTYSNHLSCYYDLCGCPEQGIATQRGGFRRRGVLFAEHFDPERTVAVDAGRSSCFSSLRPSGFDSLPKSAAVMRGFTQLGYDAVNLSHWELYFPLAELQAILAAPTGPFEVQIRGSSEPMRFEGEYAETVRRSLREAPLVSANVFADGAPLFPPYRLVERASVRIAITGITWWPAQNDSTTDYNIRAPEQVLERLMPGLVAGSHLQVLLADCTQAYARELARAFPELDVIIFTALAREGGVGRLFLPPTPAGPAGGAPYLTRDNDRGQYQAILDLTVTPEGVGEISGESVLLDMRFERPDHPAYRGFDWVTSVRVPPPPAPDAVEGNAVVPARECQECHHTAYETWLHSRHAHAFDAMLAEGRDEDILCVQCHTWGFRYRNGGWWNIDDPDDRAGNLTERHWHVTCAACHGAGRDHVDSATRGEDPPITMEFSTPRDRCTNCHDLHNDPAFEFETRWPEIRHGLDSEAGQGGND